MMRASTRAGNFPSSAGSKAVNGFRKTFKGHFGLKQQKIEKETGRQAEPAVFSAGRSGRRVPSRKHGSSALFSALLKFLHLPDDRFYIDMGFDMIGQPVKSFFFEPAKRDPVSHRRQAFPGTKPV